MRSSDATGSIKTHTWSALGRYGRRRKRSALSTLLVTVLMSQTLLGGVLTNPAPAYALTLEQAEAAAGRISAGEHHSLSVKPDGSVCAWGSNEGNQTDVPSDLDNVAAVSGGGAHSLALRNDGTAVGWGGGDYNWVFVPPGLDDAVAISAGGDHSLILRSDGTVIATGSNSSNQCDVPSGLNGVVAVAAGFRHSLALRSDRTVVAWGRNVEGQCTVPTGLNNVVAVAGGGLHSLALREDGTVVAWGHNAQEQCKVPTGLKDVVAIAAGLRHSMALKSDGTVVTWGGKTAVGTDSSVAVPAGLTDVIAISAGGLHSLALLSGGAVAAWGNNSAGQCFGVVSVQPEPYVAHIPPDATFAVSFNADALVGPEYSQIALRDREGTAVAITKELSGDVLTVTPIAPLNWKTNYTLVIPTGSLRDAYGSVNPGYGFDYVTSDVPTVTDLSSSTHPNSSTWYSSITPSFQWTGTNGATGYSYSMSQDSAAVPNDTQNTTDQFYTSAPLGDGIWYFKVKARNAEGPWGPVAGPFTVRIDATVPTGSISINSGDTHASSPNVTVSHNVAWGPSGAGQMRHIMDDGSTWTTWEGYAAQKELTLPAGDGPKTVRAEFRDAASPRNVSTALISDDIILDTTLPNVEGVGSSTHPDPDVWYPSDTPSFHWTVVDGSTGVDGYSYSLSQDPAVVPNNTVNTNSQSFTSGALSDGIWYFKVKARSSSGLWGSATGPVKVRIETRSVIPIAGDGRYDTAVEASKEAYPAGLSPAGHRTVVIATGRNWPDALGGSALAGALDGPILLVPGTSVPAVVATEITRLGATKAIVVGGEGAVAPAVVAALEGAGLTVERVWGTDRYRTADAVAAKTIEILQAGEGYDGTAFVATGASYADAVAAAPLAASQGWPLFLAHPTAGVRAHSIDEMGDVTDVFILGGTGAVSAPVQSALAAALDPSVDIERLAGDNRYETAAVIAAHGVDHAGLQWNRVGIATGQSYPDALAGGVLQGKVGSVMLLTRSTSLSSEPAATLTTNKAAITTVTYFGGLLAVDQSVRNAVSQILK